MILIILFIFFNPKKWTTPFKAPFLNKIIKVLIRPKSSLK